MAYDPAQLAALGRRHQRLRAELDALRPELTGAILDAVRAGVRQVEIVRATGYTRDRLRQIVREASHGKNAV